MKIFRDNRNFSGNNILLSGTFLVFDRIIGNFQGKKQLTIGHFLEDKQLATGIFQAKINN